MYKHILIPTDGSDLSQAAIEQGVRFAKQIGARVTAVHTFPEFHTFTYHTEMLEDTREEYLKHAKDRGDQYLDVVRKFAAPAGVEWDAQSVVSDHPYEAIINVANAKHCDLIVMASHGRRGVQAMLLGSETQKVLIHSKIPVLVYR